MSKVHIHVHTNDADPAVSKANSELDKVLGRLSTMRELKAAAVRDPSAWADIANEARNLSGLCSQLSKAAGAVDY